MISDSAEPNVQDEQAALARLEAFQELVELLKQETVRSVLVFVAPQIQGDSAGIKFRFKSFWGQIRVYPGIDYGPLDFALSTYLWPKKATACQKYLSNYLDTHKFKGRRGGDWYRPVFLDAIQSIPSAVSRLEEMHKAGMDYLKSGQLKPVRKAYLKRLHGKRVKKSLSEALKFGLEKEDVVELLDEVIVKGVMES